MEQVSILHPTTCGFLKVAAYELVLSNLTLDERILNVQELFDYEVGTETINRNFPKICKVFQSLGKRKKEIRKKILSTFSISERKKLKPAEKLLHQSSNCQGCMKNENFVSLLNELPVKKQARTYSKEKAPIPSEVKEKAREVFMQANLEFKESFPGYDFVEILDELPELGLQKKSTWVDERDKTREIARKVKDNIERHKNETAVLRTFGSDISLRKRNQLRMNESFESITDC